MADFHFDLLSLEEMEKVKEATFQLMERTGLRVYSPEALALLKAAGAKVSDTNLVRIPRALTEKALASAPSKIDIFDRHGDLAMELTGRNSYFGPGVTCPYFNDPMTLERRLAVKDDVVATATVADALKNIDFLMSLCMISDKTPQLADVHEVDAMLRNSTKPLLTWAFNADNLKDIIAMAEAVAGGAENLRQKPNIIVYAEPTTPLAHSKEALEKLMYMAKKGLPLVYSPGMTFGGTAPVTLAGALTIGLADVLCGVTVSQLVREGTPIICSSNGGVLDLKSFQAAYGSPEMLLMDGAGTQMLRFFGIPSFGLAGATDSKTLDAQAAMEVTAEIIADIGMGANLIHDFGMSDVGMTGSLQLMVFCEEVAGYARRLTQGFATDENGFAADAIDEVGPNGNFLAAQHTFDHFQKELYVPSCGIRQDYNGWLAAGKKTMADRINEKIVHLLKNHHPEPLNDSILTKLDGIVAAAEARYGGAIEKHQ